MRVDIFSTLFPPYCPHLTISSYDKIIRMDKNENNSYLKEILVCFIKKEMKKQNLSIRAAASLCSFDTKVIHRITKYNSGNENTMIDILGKINPSIICKGDLINNLDNLISTYFYSLIIDELDKSVSLRKEILGKRSIYEKSVLLYRFKLFLLISGVYSYPTQSISVDKAIGFKRHLNKLNNVDQKLYYDALSVLHTQSGLYHKAIHFSKSALAIDSDDLYSAYVYYHLTRPLFMTSAYAYAFYYGKRAYDLFCKIKAENRLNRCMQILALISNKINDYELSLKINKMLIDIAKNNGDKELLIHSFNNYLWTSIKTKNSSLQKEILSDATIYEPGFFDDTFYLQALYISYFLNDYDLYLLWISKFIRNSNNIYTYEIDAITAYFAHDLAKAIEILESVLKHFADNFHDEKILATYLLADLYMKEDDKDRVIKYQNIIINDSFL